MYTIKPDIGLRIFVVKEQVSSESTHINICPFLLIKIILFYYPTNK